MTRLLISTSIRHTPSHEPSGFLYTFHLEKGEIIRKSATIEPPYRDKDTNPRGGVRGCKGIALDNDQIIITNASYLFRYDFHWNPLGYFGHPSCAGIHDILLQDDSIWVTSAFNDLLIRFGFDGELREVYDLRKYSNLFSTISWKPPVFLRTEKILSGSLDFRDPGSHDPHFTDAAHVNGVDQLWNGDLLVSCGLLLNPKFARLLLVKKWMKEKKLWDHFLSINLELRKLLSLKANMHSDLVVQPAHGHSAILYLRASGELSLLMCFYGPTVPSHSVRVLKDNSAVYLNTTTGELIHFDANNGAIIFSTKIGKQFLRGSRQLADGTLALGDHHDLIHYDLYQRRMISRYRLTENKNESVYDIHILPDHFDLPPQSFFQHHQLYLPVEYCMGADRT